MDDGKGADEIGKHTKAYRETAPEMMAELMREWLQKRSLNERAKIRLKMKAILDFHSVDTEYPKQPAMPAPGRGPVGRAVPAFAEPMDPVAPAMGGFQERMGGPGAVRPIPGAEPVNNDDILG